MIQLQNITKLYGTVIGVNDITLSLPAGAYGLIGPNGSGKTTLLNLITGQLRPTVGTLRVLGQPPWNRDGLLRSIGFCPAVDVLHPNVSAFDWVQYLVEMHGYPRREAASRARDSLERVGLGGIMNRKMGTYSLGMRQRTKLAQAFAHDPMLMILDEPFNGLDPIGRLEMTNLLRGWVREGRSLILASHILHEVEAISPSFLLIRGGRLLASGSPDEVHRLLAKVPSQMKIVCDQADRLAKRLIDEAMVESIEFGSNGRELTFTTCNPLDLFGKLPKWTDELGIQIDELRSTDDSLQHLFTSLMHMHRGEVS